MQAALPFLLQMEPNRRVNSFYVCNTESILPALLCESQKDPSNSVLAMLAGSTPSQLAPGRRIDRVADFLGACGRRGNFKLCGNPRLFH